MAQIKYLDLLGLEKFWEQAKNYIDTADSKKINTTDIVNDFSGGTSKVLSAEQGKALKASIDSISGGELTVPVATGIKIGGVKSGGDITVAGDGAVTVNTAAKLKTAQTISLTGGATGSTTFDGSKAASIAVTVDPAQHQHTIAQVTDLQTTLDAKAPLASPALTGTPTAPTAGAGTNTTQIATTAFVKAAIDSAVGDSDHIAIKGTVNTSTPLPTENYVVGDAYIVGEAGTYAGETCEAGDWIIAIKDYAADGAPDSDWSKIQKNITSAVTFTGTPTAGQVVKFNAATGIVENASFTEAQVSGAITKAGSAVQSVTMATPSGDANPSASVDAGVATINLPAYLLKSTYDTAIAGIDGTIKGYVDTAVSGATLTAGTVTETGTNAISISGKAINITLKAYALASEVTALKALVGSTPVSEQISTAVDAAKTALIGADGDLSSADTIKAAKKYADEKVTAASITSGKVVEDQAANSVSISGNAITINLKDYATNAEVTTAIDGVINATNGTATAGAAAYIPTVAISTTDIEKIFSGAN